MAAGSTTVTVTASDGALSATQTIAVTVVSNRAPTAKGSIPAQTLTAGRDAATVDVSSYFSDADDDTLTYTASSSATSKATVSVSSATVTITPKAGGSATVTVTASDGTDTATQTIAVTVETNKAPTKVSSIPAQTLTVGGSAATMDVSSYFSDPDGDSLSYTALSSNIAKATVSKSAATITITPVAAGSVTVTVTATDGIAAAAQTIAVTVKSKPTKVGSIPAMTVTMGKSAKTVDVSSYFKDADGDTLTYTATSSDNAKATVSVSSSTVSVTPKAVGTPTVTVTATDPSNNSVDQTISVAVVNNRKPTKVGTIPNQTVAVGRNAKTVDVSGYFSDPDDDTLTYTASSSAEAKATVSVSESTVSIAAVAKGSATITVTASDGALSVAQTIAVTVSAQANRAPTKEGTIPAMTVSKTKGAETVDVSGYFSDPDADTLTYTASSNATSKATVGVSSATLTITPVAAGSATITVTASDGALSVKQTIAVTVVSNRTPIAKGTIPSQTLTVGRGTAEVDVSSKFTDPDGTTLSYSATSNAKSKATVSVSSSTVTITPVAAGSGTITVTASDGTATATQSISVTVEANTPPKTVIAIPAMTLTVGTAGTVDASLYFTDPDSDTLTYTASSSDSGKATTSKSGSTITITPVAAGDVIITVIARDGIAAAAQTIAVTVKSAPKAVGTIPAMTASVSKGPESVDVSPYFNDADGDELNYTASSSATTNATVGALGSTITITPKAAGSATITVTATDPSNNSATQTIAVTVVANRAPTAKGTIPAQTVNVGGNAKTVNVSPYFSDPDGTTLTYTASSSATTYATVGVSGCNREHHRRCDWHSDHHRDRQRWDRHRDADHLRNDGC